MAGLSRFDFYPRDWHLDTRDLSNGAKGIYIDLLSAMYARGGPLPHDERELCRLCGCATARSLRPLLGELLDKQKLKVVDGHLVNNRVMEEIAKAERRQAIAISGGHAKAEAEIAARRGDRNGVQAEFGSNSARTRVETPANIVENQGDEVCSPSPSPSVGTEEDKSSSAADAAAIDPKKPLYDFGKAVLGESSGGQVTKLLRHYSGDLDAVMRTLRLAAGKSTPREWVGAILRGDGEPRTADVLAETERLYRDLGVSA